MLSSDGQHLDHVLELTVDVDEVVARLVKRAAEQGRSDDTEDVIRRRLEVYFEQTAPLTAMYEAQGLLVRVNGLGAIDEVTARIVAALAIAP
jgi:adenylate kinase